MAGIITAKIAPIKPPTKIKAIPERPATLPNTVVMVAIHKIACPVKKIYFQRVKRAIRILKIKIIKKVSAISRPKPS